jgi:hypothetical protein
VIVIREFVVLDGNLHKQYLSYVQEMVRKV